MAIFSVKAVLVRLLLCYSSKASRKHLKESNVLFVDQYVNYFTFRFSVGCYSLCSFLIIIMFVVIMLFSLCMRTSEVQELIHLNIISICSFRLYLFCIALHSFWWFKFNKVLEIYIFIITEIGRKIHLFVKFSFFIDLLDRNINKLYEINGCYMTF